MDGEGKGWARGKTAAMDGRVARNAAAHRGRFYVRRTPLEACRWRGRSPAARVPPGWTPEVAYAVGLIATDGCLIEQSHQIAFVTSDHQLMETFLTCLGRPGQYRTALTRIGNTVYRAQFKDVTLYRWLESTGLMPRKSLTLGAIDVPDSFLIPLVRGLLDGDGTVLNKVYRSDTRASRDYYWEYLQTRFVSASRPHLDWLRDRLHTRLSITGYLGTSRPRAGRHPIWTLRYGKPASVVLLTALYAEASEPRLERKYRIWSDYRDRHKK